MSVSCRICLLLCMCVCKNKPDLEFSFLLPVMCAAALVVGALVAGASWIARSEGLPVPELQDNPHLAPCEGNHQGGGYEAESRWRSSIWQLERISSSPMWVEGLWHQSSSHADIDDRLPAGLFDTIDDSYDRRAVTWSKGVYRRRLNFFLLASSSKGGSAAKAWRPPLFLQVEGGGMAVRRPQVVRPRRWSDWI